MSRHQLVTRVERWPIADTFRLSRGEKTEAVVVVAELRFPDEPEVAGRGESVPYARYGEDPGGVVSSIESVRELVEVAEDPSVIRADLARALPAGAARNALDCALWDLSAKQLGRPVWNLAGLTVPEPVTTAFTLSLDTPEAMGTAAHAHAGWPVLKMKVGGPGDLARVSAVRQGAPLARLIVDANEGWSTDDYVRLVPKLAELGVALIEQPLLAGQDDALCALPRPIPLCADESCHDRATLSSLVGRYDVVNVKLDKTGGLTEAICVVREARALGLGVMVGCMVSTSLAIAPAVLIAQGAEHVDLDGAILLARDRDGGLRCEGSRLHPPDTSLWG